MPGISRRSFLRRLGATAACLSARPTLGWTGATHAGARWGGGEAATSHRFLTPGLGFPDPGRRWRGDSSVAAWLRAGGQTREREPRRASRRPEPDPPVPAPPASVPLAARFEDLPRHFVFEYYPWYATAPWRHWDESGRMPPIDIAASSYPLLGPYDSRARHVLEQHARWMAEAGVGAVNLSWWGRGSFEDGVVDTVMDVMRDHGLRVTFHLEPYRDDRGSTLADDVLYVVRRYGDRRAWDAMLVLRDADGRAGPVFKLFRAVLPREVTDCLGRVHRVPDYTEDDQWRRQLTVLRRELRRTFDHVRVLGDALDVGRIEASGFDGMAVYDNFVAPSSWPGHAAAFSASDLLFAFNVNAGYDGIVPRPLPDDPCWRPLPFEPGRLFLDWSDESAREEAARLSSARIVESFDATVRLQLDPGLANARRGFFLVYVNSFNEWYEGTQFEPMRDAHDLSADERAVGYHNPRDGWFRLRSLQALIARESERRAS